MKKVLTTKKDFRIFQSEVKKWIKKFGLDRYCLYFQHIYTEETEDDHSISMIKVDLEAMYCIFIFGKDWTRHTGGKGEKEIRETAREEVVHLLLAPYRTMVFSRNISEQAVNSAEHSIVYAILNLLKDMK